MLLQQVKECRDQLSEFRRKRNRCRDYTYGRQWNDIIEVDGRRISEYEYILREGNVPLKNNLIRRIVRNVLGVARQKLPETLKEYYSGDLRKISEINSLEELFSRCMEEFLISGMAVVRKRLIPHPLISGNTAAPFTEIVSPDSFFFNTDSRDIRGLDLDMVGQVHNVSFNDWCKAFVNSREDYREACKVFGDTGREISVTEVWRKEMVERFLVHDPAKGRLYKVKAVNNSGDNEPGNSLLAIPKDMFGKRKKWFLEETWRYYFITDSGEILKEGDSPYMHRSHPFIMKCYPFLDGEIQSFVGDMIDQQRYTNRLITLYDWVIRASAKGVLLLPEGSVDPRNLRAVADQWSRFNGVIVYKSKPENPEPKQISGNMANLGISELLEIQLKMMEDVSGVNGILQGNTSGGNVSGELYNSQTANAMNSLTDILETFNSFILKNAEMDSLLLKQMKL